MSIAMLVRAFDRRRGARERGSAIVEFVFVAIMVLMPLLYLITAVAVIQRGRLAVTDAARDVGRAWVLSQSGQDAPARVAAALRISLAGQGLSVSDVQVRYVSPGASCDSAGLDPSSQPGSDFAVCVTRHVQLPAIPNFVAGRGVSLVGKFVVHPDDYAVGAS